jgi:hypothetical protein
VRPCGNDDDVHVLAALAGAAGGWKLEPADVDVGAQRLAEASDAVVDVGGGLAVGEAVEKAAVAEARLLLDAHLVAFLEVAEVLLPEARVLVDAGGDAARVLDGAANAAQRLQRAAVRGDVEVDLPVIGCLAGVGGEDVPEAAFAVLSVLPAFGGEADARVGPRCTPSRPRCPRSRRDAPARSGAATEAAAEEESVLRCCLSAAAGTGTDRRRRQAPAYGNSNWCWCARWRRSGTPSLSSQLRDGIRRRGRGGRGTTIRPAGTCCCSTQWMTPPFSSTAN